MGAGRRHQLPHRCRQPAIFRCLASNHVTIQSTAVFFLFRGGTMVFGILDMASERSSNDWLRLQIGVRS